MKNSKFTREQMMFENWAVVGTQHQFNKTDEVDINFPIAFETNDPVVAYPYFQIKSEFTEFWPKSYPWH